MRAYLAEIDTELMLRVRDGDLQSFGLLLERHRYPVTTFLNRIVQNRAIAEELSQEVFLRVFRSRASYLPTAKFRTWLFKIAMHVALNSIRDERHEKERQSADRVLAERALRHLADRQPTIEESLLEDVRVQEIRSAIDDLPEKQRAAVILHKYHELDYTQIAAALGVSESAVKSLLFRAYARLRNRLAYLTASVA